MERQSSIEAPGAHRLVCVDCGVVTDSFSEVCDAPAVRLPPAALEALRDIARRADLEAHEALGLLVLAATHYLGVDDPEGHCAAVKLARRLRGERDGEEDDPGPGVVPFRRHPR